MFAVPWGNDADLGARCNTAPGATMSQQRSPYKTELPVGAAPTAARLLSSRRRAAIPSYALTGITAITTSLFLLYGAIYLHWRLTSPPRDPVGPDLGLGMLILLGLLNVPVLLAWLA